jgi:hypothetical protein
MDGVRQNPLAKIAAAAADALVRYLGEFVLTPRWRPHCRRSGKFDSLLA